MYRTEHEANEALAVRRAQDAADANHAAHALRDSEEQQLIASILRDRQAQRYAFN